VNANSIEFTPLLPLPVMIAAAVAVLAILALCLVTRARGGWWRVAVGAGLLFVLLRPTLVSEMREPQKDIVVVAVDESPSTEVAGRKAEIDAAVQRLRRQLSAYSEKLDVREVRIRHESIADAGDGTRIYNQLSEAFGDIPRRRAAGAIVLTDGQVHDLPKRLDAVPIKAPVHVLLAGKPDMLDRRLVVVNAPAYGIVGNTVSVTLRVEDAGRATGDPARLVVRRDGETLVERNVVVGRDTVVSAVIEHGGSTVMEFSVDKGPEELTIENNRAVLSINGVRDRLRVLLVSGEPHPGERTWRNLLKSDPSVDLVHFTILRPPEKQDGTPINELSLISFPTRELFEVKLDEFDLVIFDRYRRRGVLPPVYLQNIVDFVRDGGALLEAVGPSFAGPFSIYRTPLGQLLPAEPTGQTISKPFRPQVTDIGRRHPVTANLPGSGSGGDDAPTWGRWLRQIDVSLTRGSVLMSGAGAKPLLVLDRYHKGRVAQFNSDHIWLWARGFEGGGPQAELLRRLAHWLMKEPDLEENDLRMSFDGDRLKIVRRSVDKPETADIELTGPGGDVRRLTLQDDGDGRGSAVLDVRRSGLYTARDGERTALAAVGALNPKEFADLRSTEALLRPLVEKTGGGMMWLDAAPSPAKLSPAKSSPIDIRRIQPGRTASGNRWIGLWRNEDYIVTGVDRTSLLPPLLALLLLCGLVAMAWKREAD